MENSSEESFDGSDFMHWEIKSFERVVHISEVFDVIDAFNLDRSALGEVKVFLWVFGEMKFVERILWKPSKESIENMVVSFAISNDSNSAFF